LIGNEDCGQMSAWYVLSSMGIYQVTPGEDYWQTMMPPYFENVKATKTDGRKEFVLSTNDRTGFLNQEGKETVEKEFVPSIIPVPVIEAESKSFKDKMMVQIKGSKQFNQKIYYRINEDSKEVPPFIPYSEAFEINKSSKVEAYIERIVGGKPPRSNTISAQFFKKPNNYTVDIKSKYNPQYHAGGNEGLIDGIFGNENWRKGEWQGYQNEDFEATIDMQVVKNISEIRSNYLQDTRSWILMPTKVEYYISEDNIKFTKVGTVENSVDPKEYETVIKSFDLKFTPQKARYVKVIATNFGKLPEWHQGFPSNGDAFIFIDEITVN
ncbi:MAG: glycoside hydrolase domain-containing protein, partial [Flavobacterium sp.]